MTIDSLVSEEKSSTAHCLCCGDPLSSGVLVCPDCGAPSHGDCWDYIGGCGVMGCSARGTKLDEKVRGRDGQLTVIGDVSLPAAPKPNPARNYGWFLARLRSLFSSQDEDVWIDSYLDEVRSSLKGVRFVELSNYVDPRKAVEFCEKNGAVLASAQECAFFSIVNDLNDHKVRRYTSTFSFGFKDGGDSVVAYVEVSHKDWLYLIGKMPGLLSREDPVVSSAIARAVDEGRVVPAKEGWRSEYSCVPNEDRSSDFDKDAHNRAIFQRAAKPWGLLRYRKGLNTSEYIIPSGEIKVWPNRQVVFRPLWLGGGGYCDDLVRANDYFYNDGYGRVFACSVVAKIGDSQLSSTIIP
ncbi:MAG: RING finger protein [Nanoarchaeota archaeon]